MKTIYRGHEIDVTRDKCLAGYSMIYYSIMYGDYECVSSYQDTRDTVKTITKHLKRWVDSAMEDEFPWDNFSKDANGKLIELTEEL